MIESASTTPGTDRTSGLRRRVVAVAWLLTMVAVLCLTIAGEPARYQQLHSPCQPPACAELQLASGDMPILQRHLSMTAYAAYEMALENMFVIGCFALAALIFWRRSGEWMAVGVSLTLAFFGPSETPLLEALALTHRFARPPTLLIQDLASACVIAVYLLFPSGCFVPRWTRWVAYSWLGWNLARPLFIQHTPFLPGRPEAGVFAALLGLGIASQLYRYRRVSHPLERQQSKWVVFGLSVAGLGMLAYVLLHLLLPQTDRPGAAQVLSDVVAVPLLLSVPGLLVPVSIAVAILRYRLYDIDVIVRRTVVYTALTAALALDYAASVLLLQRLFDPFTGGSQLAVAGSTLAVAVAFQPARRRIQAAVDRRFARSSYDAAREMARFGSAARAEVDLDHLVVALADVIAETVHPAQLSIWIRPDLGDRPDPAHGTQSTAAGLRVAS